MSIESWQEEFYPIDASKMKGASNVAQIEHCLRKWRGLTPEALEKHELIAHEDGAYDDASHLAIGVGVDDCALCQNHHTTVTGENGCRTCPLAIARDGFPCFDKYPDEEQSPCDAWEYDQDARPMIGWLEEALEHERKTRERKTPAK